MFIRTETTFVGLISSSENMRAKFKRSNNISFSNELTNFNAGYLHYWNKLSSRLFIT